MPGPGALLVATSETSDVASVMAAAADTLRAWVGLGPVFLASADPVTGSFTGTFAFDVPDAAAAAFFAGKDVARLAGVLPVLAGALRRVALAVAPEQTQLDTGVILFDQYGRMTGSTGGAGEWLAEMDAAGPGGLPLIVAGLTGHVLASGRTATSAITTRAGRAGVLEAALLDGSPEPQVVIVISAAPAPRRLDQLAAASGLTSRELQVIECVLSGHSTTVIARELGISPYTVQAQLTSIFSKTGHRSRRELISRLRR